MKLYFSPGACSLAPHIALREADADFELVRVDFADRKTEDGADYLSINPLGKVPALELDDGEIITENPAIMLYIADAHKETKLAPPEGSRERYRVLSRLSFLSSEVHKSFVPLFAPGATDDAKAAAREAVINHLAFLEKEMDGREYFAGDAFSIADIYLFVILGWPAHVGIDLSPYPNLRAYAGKVGQRDVVTDALKAEGLV